jgi:hypothetical protein
MPVKLEEKTLVPMYEPDRWIGHGDSGDVGGWPFEYLPPIDPWARQNVPYALVGFDIRKGTLIDGVTPLYRELKDDGNVGDVVSGNHYGGWGGYESQVGTAGSWLAFLAPSPIHGPVGRNSTCVSSRSNWQSGSVSPFGRWGGFPAYINAPPGHCAIGIHGKGGSLDRVSIVARPVIF